MSFLEEFRKEKVFMVGFVLVIVLNASIAIINLNTPSEEELRVEWKEAFLDTRAEFIPQVETTLPIIDEGAVALEKDTILKHEFNKTDLNLYAEILDISKGNDFRRIDTEREAGGDVRAGIIDGKFTLEAEINNLPEPKIEGDYYEAWLLNRDTLEIVSTGVLVRAGDVYKNFYITETDLTNFDYYMVTLELPDNNPYLSFIFLEADMGDLEKY